MPILCKENMPNVKDVPAWPLHLDMTKDECKRTLRALELSAYSNIVSVFRAQGEFTKEKKKFLSDLQLMFCISVERHRAEIRRAVNDEILNTIAHTLAGPNTNTDWAIEGRRLVPLLPRAPPQVAYTALATRMAQLYCGINAKLPSPSDTAMFDKMEDVGAESEFTDSEGETEGLRYFDQSMVPSKFVSDQGHYSTLPSYRAKLGKEKLKKKKEYLDQILLGSQPKCLTEGNSCAETSRKTKRSSPSVTEESENSRKRKRPSSADQTLPPPAAAPAASSTFTSSSSEESLSDSSSLSHSNNNPESVVQSGPSTAAVVHPPPPPPPPLRPQSTSLVSSLSGSSMKITVTGGVPSITPTVPVSQIDNKINSQQKVILVSTSASSFVSAKSICQRPISVPILKSSSHHLLGSGGISSISNPPAILKSNSFPSATAAAGNSDGVSYGCRAAPRPRSNSLVLPSDTHKSSSSSPSSSNSSSAGSMSAYKREGSLPKSIIGGSFPSQSSSSASTAVNSNLTNRSVAQLKCNSLPALKGTQIKQEGVHNEVWSANGTSISVVGTGVALQGHRIRTVPPSPAQSLFVVSTTPGTITVVTRTVASAPASTPRVVTMNPSCAPKASILRGLPSSVSSPRITTGIRPVLGGGKGNVIVVHKGGALTSGVRPVGIQGIKDLSNKIITKPSLQSSNNGTSGILSGTLVIRPSSPNLSSSNTATGNLSAAKDPKVKSTSASSVENANSLNASSGSLIILDVSSENSQIDPPELGTSKAPSGKVSVCGSSSTVSSQSVECEDNDKNSEPQESTSSSSSSSNVKSFKREKNSSKSAVVASKETLSGGKSFPDSSSKAVPLSSSVSGGTAALPPINEEVVESDSKLKKLAMVSSISLKEHEGDEQSDWFKICDDVQRASKVVGDDGKTDQLPESDDDPTTNAVAADEVIERVTTDDQKERDQKDSSPVGEVASAAVESTDSEEKFESIVEKAVEVLKEGNPARARSLLQKAGMDLIESAAEGSGEEGDTTNFMISSLADDEPNSSEMRGPCFSPSASQMPPSSLITAPAASASSLPEGVSSSENLPINSSRRETAVESSSSSPSPTADVGDNV